ncbi:MAG TPA: hypothetical protein VNX18_20545 [Bryobacteraceae bacterium]|nr:hypothetical protein [Bryobacteraceae bacterium]
MKEHDLRIYIAVATTLAVSALAACIAPAWRASRVDPAMTLRSE